MSKYNKIKSIPIETIKKEEIPQAIKEWSEGDKSLEKLLWACYNNGIKTSGCHAGSGPYIDFEYQDDFEKIIPIIETAENKVGAQILIMIDGGNPFSGPDWYKPTIGIHLDTEYKDEVDVFFDELTNSLKNENIKNNHSMLRLLEFFSDKESALSLRFMHKEEGKYTFYIESRDIPKNRYDYYKKMFSESGLIEVVNNSDNLKNRHGWKIESDNLDDVLSKLNHATNHIISNYSLDIPKSEDEIISFIMLAKYMKRTSSENKFDEWLREQEIKYGIKPKADDNEKELHTMLNDNQQQMDISDEESKKKY